MGKLDGSKTLENLKAAFAGESQARNKYTYYASKAKAEGYEQIAAIFTETADNEKEHAKRLGKFIGIVEDTVTNLMHAAEGENYEWTTMYKEFEATAREEGFNDVAEVFKHIGLAEVEHEKRFLKLRQNILDGEVFVKDAPLKWKCRNCGYVHEGEEAPMACPACAHPQAFFEMLLENY